MQPKRSVLSLLYVKDAIRGLVMLYDAPIERTTTKVYNLGQIMPAPSIGDVYATVMRCLPQANITFKPDQSLTNIIKKIPERIKGDRAELEWGWKAEYGLVAAVEDFIEGYKNRGKTSASG
jgi:nucleoside-diphosphate-sugar epimerase